MREIKCRQEGALLGNVDEERVNLEKDAEGILRLPSGTIWIPSQASPLKMRLCVVAHYGLGGHRGVQATLASLKRFFEWKGMQADVDKFVSNCLHCNGAAGCVK
jgi:hypothetical protein